MDIQSSSRRSSRLISYPVEERLSDWTEGLVVRKLHEYSLVYTEKSGNRDVLLWNSIKVGSEYAKLGSRIQCRLTDLKDAVNGANQRVYDYEVLQNPSEWSVDKTGDIALFTLPVVFKGHCNVRGRRVRQFHNDNLSDEILDLKGIIPEGNNLCVGDTVTLTIRRKRLVPENINLWVVLKSNGLPSGESTRDSTVAAHHYSESDWMDGIVCGVDGHRVFVSTNEGEAIYNIPNKYSSARTHWEMGGLITCKVRSRLPSDGYTESTITLIVTKYEVRQWPEGWKVVSTEKKRLLLSCPCEYSHVESGWIVLKNTIISKIFDMKYLVEQYCRQNRMDREDVRLSSVHISKCRLPRLGSQEWHINRVTRGGEREETERYREDDEGGFVTGIVCNYSEPIFFVNAGEKDAILREGYTRGDVQLGTVIKCRIGPRVVTVEGHAEHAVIEYYVPNQPDDLRVYSVAKSGVTMSCPARFSAFWRGCILLCSREIDDIFDTEEVVKKYCRKHSLDPRDAAFSRVLIKRSCLIGTNGRGRWVVVRVEEERKRKRGHRDEERERRRESTGEDERDGERERKRRRESVRRRDSMDRRRESSREERGNDERGRKKRRERTGMSGRVERDHRRSSNRLEYASSSRRPSTPESIDGFVIKKRGVYFVVWTPNGLALIFDDLSVKGKKAELGSFIQCKLGELPSPILDGRLTYTHKVIDYSVDEIQRYGRGIVRGEHAVISCRIHFLEFRSLLQPLPPSQSDLPSENAYFKHPLLGEVADENNLIQNPAPGDLYQVIVKGIPINEFTIGWIVEREEGEEKERKEKVEEERGEVVVSERQSVEQIPSETASYQEKSQMLDSMVRRLFSHQFIRDYLKEKDEPLFSDVFDQLTD